ncbi:MAG: hypothetical protein GX558_08020, partial [Clostridiales bacterium]|nr:hypothetical protein [Clostridiales bacterium]
MDRRLAAALIAALMILVLATSAMAASTDNAAYFVLGASGAPVKQLQARLAHLGFYDSLV